MARPLWRGSLSFGLVNVPVALVSAVRDLDVHFNQLHADSHVRLEVKRACKKGGHEVPYEEIGYGYTLDSGKHKGKEIEFEEPEPREASDDLLAALQASLEGSGNGRKKKGKGKR